MLEVKIGETIKVGGYDYEIRCSEEGDEDLESRNEWGEHSSYFKRVTLRSKSSPQQFSETFIHEALCHAVDHIYLNDSLSENQVAVISNGIHQILEQLGVRFVKGDL